MPKFFGFAIGFVLAWWGAWSVWVNHIVPLVPHGDYHGLIVFGLAVGCLFFFGGLVFFIAMICGLALAQLAAIFTDGK